MKTFVLFILRLVAVFIFEWITYLVSPAQSAFCISSGARVVLSPGARIFASSVKWAGNGAIELKDSSMFSVAESISGFDSSSRFFILGNHASLKRKVSSITSYIFPIGYSSGSSAYRGFTLNMQSLGSTGAGSVSVQLVPNVSGGINYQKYFPNMNGGCLSGSSISFNCLNTDGWHCDGPSDYEYSVFAHVENACGNNVRRIIKTSTGTHAWQDSIESVIGNLQNSFCDYSDWTGNSNNIPGGTYKNFSDFVVASGVSLLPVTLVDLRANPIDRCIRVSWKTELELNNEKFLIGRSIDGMAFTIIGEVAGHGTTTVPQEYLFDDCSVDQNILYYYQLEQVDYDGHTDWSPIVSAKLFDDEIITKDVFNLLGQKILENQSGFSITRFNSKNGSRVFKTVTPSWVTVFLVVHLSSMKSHTKFMKFLLPAALVVSVIAITLVTLPGSTKHPQQAALYGSLQVTPTTPCLLRIGANGVPVAPTPAVHLSIPNGGQVYHPGDSVPVKWSTCGIPATDKIQVHLDYVSSTGALINSFNMMFAITGWPGTSLTTLNTGQATVMIPGASAGNGYFWGPSGFPYGNHFKITVWHDDPAIGWFEQDSSDGLITIQ
jgi:hypothetical protein